MARPMTPGQIVSQLRAWGVPYKEYRSWRTHNRNHKGAWGPVNGFMVHHTGSDSRDQRSLLYNGVSGLPGPLCQFGLAQDGIVHLVGWGRANHAGAGDPDVLRAVINESYGKYPPRDNQSSVDGNSRFYGVEIWYSGSNRMTDAQYRSLRLLACAVLDYHNWGEKSVIGHGEWGSPGKWDPGIRPGVMMDMAEVRSDIKTTLAGGGAGGGDDEVSYEKVWKEDGKMVSPWGSKENPTWQPESILERTAKGVKSLEEDVADIKATLSTLDVAGIVDALESVRIRLDVTE